jgi:ribosomal protein L37AE/L43A
VYVISKGVEMTDKNANTEIRKEFCPNCEAETPCTHEAELFVCDICGEDFAKYIVSRNCNVSDVSMTRDVSTDVKTPQSIENTNPDYYKGEVHELHFTEALRNLAKRNPADVSAIGVSVLIDHIEELEKEIERLNTMLKSKEVVIASQEGRINKLALDLLQIKGLSE